MKFKAKQHLKWILITPLIIHSTILFASDIHHIFKNIKSHPKQLRQFVEHMPIGGDLHNHMDGAISVENLIRIAKRADYSVCSDYKICSSDHPGALKLKIAEHDQKMKQQLIHAWTMRKVSGDIQKRRDHFFSTFLKFWPVIMHHRGEVLSEILLAAAKQKLQYIELMILSEDNAAVKLAESVKWDSDFKNYLDALHQAGIKKIVEKIPSNINSIEQHAKKAIRL